MGGILSPLTAAKGTPRDEETQEQETVASWAPSVDSQLLQS